MNAAIRVARIVAAIVLIASTVGWVLALVALIVWAPDATCTETQAKAIAITWIACLFGSLAVLDFT